MELFGQAVSGVQLVVWVGLVLLHLVVKVYAFTDAVRQRADLYPAAGKRTKNVWAAITGISLAVNLLIWNDPLQLLNIVGLVASAVYLADVRPALQQVSGRGGSSGGPYGGW